MKKREELEKAGWVYLSSYAGWLIFGKVDKRLLYDPAKDNVYATYSAREFGLHPFSDYEFQKLLEE